MASSAGTAGETAPDDLAVQVPYILGVLDALGFAVVGHDGYEADDVIGTLAATATRPTDVVTGDRDLFQVVDDDARGPGALHGPRGRQARARRRRLGPGQVRHPGRALRRLRRAAR